MVEETESNTAESSTTGIEQTMENGESVNISMAVDIIEQNLVEEFGIKYSHYFECYVNKPLLQRKYLTQVAYSITNNE